MKAHPYAVSVQLTIAGFLSSTLILDWLRPGMLRSEHRALAAVIPVVAPCLFGLLGFCLGAISHCRKRWFAILLTSLLAPVLGSLGAQIVWLVTGVKLAATEGTLQGIGIGFVFIPFIVMTWLRMQSKGDGAAEVASHQRASWAVVLLALATLQIFVSISATHHRSERTDVSTAIGLLAGLGLVGVCIADRRAIQSMRASIAAGDERANDVDPFVFERMRTNFGGNLACAIFASIGIVIAHIIGGAKYSLI